MAERLTNGRLWLGPEETVVAEALAKIVVPSEEEAPGIDEVCEIGPSTIDALDAIVRQCPRRQDLYSRGLLSFDIWAVKEQGC
jgi:hypothetical protein